MLLLADGHLLETSQNTYKLMIVTGSIDQEPRCTEMISISVFANCFAKHGVPDSKYLCSEIHGLYLEETECCIKMHPHVSYSPNVANDIQLQVDSRLQFLPVGQIFALIVWGPFSILVSMDV